MNELTPFLYLVTTGEIVTIEVTPIAVAAETVLGSKGGAALADQTPGSNVVTFISPITAPVNGNDLASVLCNFPETPADDADDNPRCEFRLRGSAGGGWFQGLNIKKSDSAHTADFVFHAAASVQLFAATAVKALQPLLPKSGAASPSSGEKTKGAAKTAKKKR